MPAYFTAMSTIMPMTRDGRLVRDLDTLLTRMTPEVIARAPQVFEEEQAWVAIPPRMHAKVTDKRMTSRDWAFVLTDLICALFTDGPAKTVPEGPNGSHRPAWFSNGNFRDDQYCILHFHGDEYLVSGGMTNEDSPDEDPTECYRILAFIDQFAMFNHKFDTLEVPGQPRPNHLRWGVPSALSDIDDIKETLSTAQSLNTLEILNLLNRVERIETALQY